MPYVSVYVRNPVSAINYEPGKPGHTVAIGVHSEGAYVAYSIEDAERLMAELPGLLEQHYKTLKADEP